MDLEGYTSRIALLLPGQIQIGANRRLALWVGLVILSGKREKLDSRLASVFR